MIALSQVQDVHRILIERFGGIQGIRDEHLLASALARPFQTFDGKDLYPSVIDKAASLIESILINHPSIDGNKRTGYVLMRMFLIQNGYDIKAVEQEKYEFVINIASGKSNFNDIISWLEEFTVKKKSG
jgi:death-on-curing protein